MVSRNAALHRDITNLLRAGGIEDAELEAKWILEDATSPDAAMQTARRRAQHEPLQYLLGKWEFYGLPLKVGAGVLIPRADTETLVDAVLSRIPDQAGQKIADLCTGSGCIALALAAHMEDTNFIGIDVSAEAWEYARENQMLNGIHNVKFICANVLEATTAEQFRNLAAIVCNPPYLTAEEMRHLQAEVRYEPAAALDGGADGLRFYRALTRLWRDALTDGGLLAYEIGWQQAKQVSEILAANGFSEVEVLYDLGGNARVVLGRKRDQL